MVASLWTWN